MWETIVNLLAVLHWVVYLLSLLAAVVLIVSHDVESKWFCISAFYLGIILISQALRMGCVLTDLQNIARSHLGLAPLENQFFLSFIFNNPGEIAKLVFYIGIILLLPLINKSWKKS